MVGTVWQSRSLSPPPSLHILFGLSIHAAVFSSGSSHITAGQLLRNAVLTCVANLYKNTRRLVFYTGILYSVHYTYSTYRTILTDYFADLLK